MENYNKVLEAQELQLSATGLAQERYGIYLDSIEAKTNKFTATWEEMWMKTINSDLIRGLIDLGTSVLTFINNLGGLPPILERILFLIIAIKGQEIGALFLTLVSGVGKAIPALKAFGVTLSTISMTATGLIGLLITVAGLIATIAGGGTLGGAIQEELDRREKSKEFSESFAKNAKDIAKAIKETKQVVEDNPIVPQVELVDLEKLLEMYDEIEKANGEILGSVVKTADGVVGLIKSYDDLGYATLENVEQLREMFPEDYMQALTFEGDQIQINTDVIKKLTVAKALESLQTIKASKIALLSDKIKAESALQSAKAILSNLKMSIAANGSLAQSYIEVAKAAMIAAQAQGVVDSIDAKISAIENEIAVAEEYYNQLQSGVYWTNALAEATDGAAGSVRGLTDAQEAYDALLKMTIDMLKQEKEAEKERLKESLEGYKKIIDAKKEELDLIKEKEEYEDKLADKNKEISSIDAELFEIQFDNSEEAQKRRLELEEKRAKATEELETIEAERSHELQDQSLDKEYERFEEDINAKIKLIDDYLSQTGLIAQEAMALLTARSGELYQRLIEWNRLYGDGLDSTIDKLWNQYQVLSQIAGNGSGSGNGSGGTNGNGNPKPPTTNPSTGGGGGGGHPYLTMHDGGTVGGLPKIQESEQFAKLLKGEVVATDSDMRNFMRNTLPRFASMGGGQGVGDISLEINVAGNLDKSVLPDLKSAVFEVMNAALRQRGKKTNSFANSI